MIFLYSPIMGPSWFFIVLFYIKSFSLLARSKGHLVLIAMLCVCIIFIVNKLNLSKPFSLYFLILPAVLSYPFYVLGLLLKNIIQEKRSIYLDLIFSLSSFLISFLLWKQFDSLSLVFLEYNNLLVLYLMGISGSIGTICLSKALVVYLNMAFIKDISRGTMIIVATHCFLMYTILPDIFFNLLGPSKALFYCLFMMLCYYIIIHLTYKNIPILYGKFK